jgi:hypothetical protein
MDSVKVKQKSLNPSNVGFYTQINNPVETLNLGFGSKKGDRHSKNRSEFNLQQNFQDSDYYQLSRVKDKKKKAKTRSNASYKNNINPKNFYSVKKDVLGVKSTHSSIMKRNKKKSKMQHHAKKGNSVALQKSQKKMGYSDSVKRHYKKGHSGWKKEKYGQRKVKKRTTGKVRKKEGRKRRDTIGVQSMKAEREPGKKGYSRDFLNDKKDISSMKNIDKSDKSTRKKAQAKRKEVLGPMYQIKKENSYLTSSEMSEIFEPSLDAGNHRYINSSSKWENSFEQFHKTPKNFTGTQNKQDYGSGKMDFFQARLNEIQSKYISSESYKLK